MADFSFLSDSSDDGAVEELLSQAMDLTVLEQVAAINCSSFTSDSVLPTHLETRFSRLKSFPAAKPNNTPSLSSGYKSASQSFNSHFPHAKSLKPDFPISDEDGDDEALFSKEEKGLKKELGSGSASSSFKSSNSSARNANSSNLKENPTGKIRSEAKSRAVEAGAEPDPDDDEALFSGKGLKKKLGSGSGSSSFKSSNSSVMKKNKPNGKIGSNSKSRSLKAGPEQDPFSEDDEALFSKAGKGSRKKSGRGSGSSSHKLSNSSVLKEIPNGKVRQKSKSRTGYISSPSDSSNSSMRSPSPPARTGCFWCSPKKVVRVKSKKNLDFGGDDNAEFLTDLGIFSEKEQQKILKKAMKEEEKINREAEKIVKWAKQASARINISDAEDELSD